MANPYAAPDAALTESAGDETYEPEMFALSGRIGRLRYLAYSSGSMVLMMLAFGALGALVGAVSRSAAMATVIMLLAYVVVIVLGVAYVRRRLNDLDMSGWWSLLSLVPIVNFFFGLYLIFAAGTQGMNRFGPMPTKNSSGVIWGALIIPLVFIIGIVAAIALPAYQSYVMRAKAAQAAHSVPAPDTEPSNQGQ